MTAARWKRRIESVLRVVCTNKCCSCLKAALTDKMLLSIFPFIVINMIIVHFLETKLLSATPWSLQRVALHLSDATYK